MHNAVHDSHPATACHGPDGHNVGCQNLSRLMAGGMKMSLLEWWNVDDNNKGDHTMATADSQNGMMLGTKT